MTAEIICEFLGWCSVINGGVLLLWWLSLTLAHDFIYRIHRQWFNLSMERFDAIHYALMGFFKLCIILFNIVPYVALRIAA